MKRQYQIELDRIIADPQNHGKSLLIHSCCGPCSSYCLDYLSAYFRITIFYYNPNVHPKEEVALRIEEQKKVISHIKGHYPIDLIIGEYIPDLYFEAISGYEQEEEGSMRCYRCYEFRMREAAKLAADMGYDYFTTTLTISPHKNADWINEIGEKLEEEFGVKHLTSDFKKRNGYKISTEMSKAWGIYRQDYCGCVFSKKEARARRALQQSASKEEG